MAGQNPAKPVWRIAFQPPCCSCQEGLILPSRSGGEGGCRRWRWWRWSAAPPSAADRDPHNLRSPKTYSGCHQNSASRC
jgi:hypothetical protein